MKYTREQLIHEAATKKADSGTAFRKRLERWMKIQNDAPVDLIDASDPRLAPFKRTK